MRAFLARHILNQMSGVCSNNPISLKEKTKFEKKPESLICSMFSTLHGYSIIKEKKLTFCLTNQSVVIFKGFKFVWDNFEFTRIRHLLMHFLQKSNSAVKRSHLGERFIAMLEIHLLQCLSAE